MLYEPKTIVQSIIRYSISAQESKILDKLNHELHDVEREREEQDSVIEKNESKALSELRSIREKLDLAIESRVKKLKQMLLGRSSSTKSSKLSVDRLAVSTAKVLASIDDEDGDSKTSDIDTSVLKAEIEHLERVKLSATVMANTSFKCKKLLNLTHDWLLTFFPHCMKKINRVSFGLLNKKDCEKALEKDPLMPRTRLKLAVPFLGKDVPSSSSEFAHPDVIIGSTILAYRYSGLRYSDFADVVDSLTSDFSREIGPSRDRKSSRKHEIWVRESGGRVRGVTTILKGYTPSRFAQEALARAEALAEKIRRNELSASDEDAADLFETEVVRGVRAHVSVYGVVCSRISIENNSHSNSILNTHSNTNRYS